MGTQMLNQNVINITTTKSTKVSNGIYKCGNSNFRKQKHYVYENFENLLKQSIRLKFQYPSLILF